MRRPIYHNQKFYKALKRFRKLFRKLYRLITGGFFFELKQSEKLSMLSLFNKLYSKLDRLSLRNGLKVAGLTMAFAFVSNAANAQPFVPVTGNENPLVIGYNPFSNLIELSSAYQIDLPLFQLVDLDNDGDYDLVVIRNTLDSSGPKQRLTIGERNFGKNSSQKTPFNRELRETREWQVTIEYYENIGTPEEAIFVQRKDLDNPFYGIDLGNVVYTNIMFADVDGDGNLDFIYNELTEGYNTGISYFKNIGTPESPQFAKFTGIHNPFHDLEFDDFGTPTLVDIDGNGNLDLLFSHYYGSILYYKNNAEEPGQYDFELIPPAESPFEGIPSFFLNRLEFVDFDNDGNLDLFVGTDQILYYKNTGTAENPVFELQTDENDPMPDFNVYGYFMYLSLADIDNDGDYDMLTGAFSPYLSYYGIDPIFFLENTGTPEEGEFTINGPIKVNYLANAEFIDLDGDGDLDMVLGQAFGGLRYFENVGTAENPVFEERFDDDNPFYNLPDLQTGYILNPTLIDFDGNGNYDLIVSFEDYYSYSYQVQYYKNTGTPDSPQFELQEGSAFEILYSYSYFPSKLVFADLDGDSNIDAIGVYGPELIFFKNTGTNEDPVFEVQTGDDNPFDGIIFPYTISGFDIVDFDGDGDLDLAVALFDYYDNYIVYLKNIGDSQNPEFEIASDNPFEGVELGLFSSIKLVDLDNDGDYDIVSGDYFGFFKYFRNLASPPSVAEFDIIDITQTSAVAKVVPSEPVVAHYVLLPITSEPPTINEVIGGTGSGGESPIISDNVHITSSGKNILLSSLNPNTGYSFYLVMDNETKAISELYSLDFATLPTTGITEFNPNTAVYPNPSDAYFHIDMEKITAIEVYDVTGRLIHKEEVNSDGYLLDLSGQKKGVYMLKIITENKSFTHKISLQ